jgi:DNA-binding transcriptional LysR family regulator
MDRLESMKILVAAVDAGSLSGASRARGAARATVSRKVSELEAALRAQVLVRTSRRLALTEAGAAYVAACRRIIDDIDEAERAVAGEFRAPRGDLAITAPVVFGRLHVEPVVLAFLKEYPEINVRLTLADSLLNLVDEHVDLAVRIGALPDSSLVGIRLGAIRRVVCASPAYLARRGTPQTPEDLAAHDCVLFEGLGAMGAWTFGASVAPMRPRFSVNTAEAAIDAVIAGTGITRILSYQVAAALRAGALTRVLRDFEPAPVPVTLLYAEQAMLPQKLRAFLDFAAPLLKAALGAQES